MRRLEFQDCALLVSYTKHSDHCAGNYCMRTLYNDGTFAGACPNNDPESKARAESLGYGDDLWLMTLEHEILHTLTAEYRGDGNSIILWNVAHGGGNKWPVGGREEEARSLAFAAWIHQNRWDNCLEEYKDKLTDMIWDFTASIMRATVERNSQ